MMPRTRTAVPSHKQVMILIELLEERLWLATGYARTSHARERMQAAWQEIAARLNSEKSGCLKTWKQWSKYWKDKKSAVKRKASQIQLAKKQPTDSLIEERFLSTIEERIVAVLSSEVDRKPDLAQSIEDDEVEEDATTDSESVLQCETKPTPAVLHKNNAPTASSSPRIRRLVTTRRHPTQRSPPTQMTTLTERFIAIEEKRLENERRLIDNQTQMLVIFKEMSNTWSRQTQALQDLCECVIKR